MENRINELLKEFGIEAEGAERGGMVLQLTVRLVEAERELERQAAELTEATANAVAVATAGDLRTSVRGDLLAAVTDKAAVVDAALMKVSERRTALAFVAQSVKANRAS
ncbi:hypothetical protein [Verrucosispora sp. WMMD1129]|uniref:hypothetical protein n=1 Tax=Verrucosispora sp. WMMD1129 TaxID=3016093 RepID=UPI00249CEDB8|nr:hypothetical protein [Verrucosispora sp. WMMD1129]WFE47610.1 hypothetical protein O7624_26455 [Verrucosispora sp. WMMD1129]